MEQKPKVPEQITATLEAINLEAALQGEEHRFDTADVEITRPDHPEYGVYVGALRSLRKAQRETMAEVAEEDKYSIRNSDVDAFTGAEYSPSALKILRAHEAEDFTKDIDEKRAVAIGSEEGFMKNLTERVNSSPEVVLRQFDSIQHVMPKEKMLSVARMLSEATPIAVIRNHEKLSSFADETQVRTLLDKAVVEVAKDEFRVGSKAVEILADPEMAGLFSRTQQESLAAAASASDSLYTVDNGAQTLVDAGLLEASKACDYVAERITTPAGLALAKANTGILAREGRLEDLQAAFVNNVLQLDLESDESKRLINQVFSGWDSEFITAKEESVIATDLWQRNRSFMLNANPQYCIQHFGNEAVTNAVLEAPEMLDSGAASNLILKLLHSSDEQRQFSPEEQAALLPLAAERSPMDVFTFTAEFQSALGTEWTTNFITEHIGDMSLFKVLEIEHWGNAIGLTKDEQAAIVLGRMDEDVYFGYLPTLKSSEYLKELLSKEQIDTLITSALDRTLSGQGGFIAGTDIENIAAIYGDETIAKSLLERISEERPKDFLRLLTSQYYRFDSDELQTMFNKITTDPALVEKVLTDNFSALELCLGPEQMQVWLKEQSEQHPAAFFDGWQNFKYAVNPELVDEVADRLARRNPARAWEIGGLTDTWSAAATLEFARSDETTLQTAPQYFKDLFKRFDKASEHGKRLIMKDAVVTYSLIRRIESADGMDAIAPLQEGKTPKQQYLTLVQLSLCDKSGYEGITSDEILTERAYESLATRLGIDQFTAGQRTELERVFVPFSLYAMQFEDSERMKPFLQDLARNLESSDQFAAWRKGAGDAAGLASLQAAELLPTALTAQQYSVWQEDGRQRVTENLRVTTDEIRTQIQQTLAQEVGNMGVDGLAFDMSDDERQALETSAAELGQEVGTVSKLLSSLRQVEQTKEITDEISKLAATREELAQRVSDIRIKKTLVQLWNLSDQELEAGATLTAEGKRGQTIERLLSQLRAATNKTGQQNELPNVIDRLSGLVEDYQNTVDGAQDLLIEDTTDLLTTLEIGAKPVGTCQHYISGQFNGCLMGYTEPAVKILTVRDASNESLMARSILRLLTQEDGTPALHVEAIYTQSASAGITHAVYNHAIKKAQSMGMNLFYSAVSQNENGEHVAVDLPEGLSATQSAVSLQNTTSRAPLLYVDSLGGFLNIVTDGKYTLKDLRQLQAT